MTTQEECIKHDFVASLNLHLCSLKETSITKNTGVNQKYYFTKKDRSKKLSLSLTIVLYYAYL